MKTMPIRKGMPRETVAGAAAVAALLVLVAAMAIGAALRWHAMLRGDAFMPPASGSSPRASIHAHVPHDTPRERPCAPG